MFLNGKAQNGSCALDHYINMIGCPPKKSVNKTCFTLQNGSFNAVGAIYDVDHYLLGSDHIWFLYKSKDFSRGTQESDACGGTELSQLL